ncbi:barstar family protein [Deinococcus cellulosilyticus]|uniref:Barstar (barnase inhibitor) domain-containing protein n=1 Tax=Deinococcus cellulosilyticus (strain DSM 18568 / NBRC 106333 / KACC 11606 / 5516J-15) TaxID=1223518 RepID=A0A511N9W7_DEIC1|nr:barstar family protein [Deinococcus cellulosilyticus]GEM49590.1 hypothetical protein DC3_52250 [Deinococcus cellulosilyticus NBRC 106333 = KACC 11606]
MTDLSLNTLEDCGILPLDTDEATLRAEALSHGYTFMCVDLSVVANRQDLLEAFAEDLNFPEYFGQNWDALSDCLMDFSWQEAEGYVLVLEGTRQLSVALEDEYDTLMEILEETVKFWQEQDVPFWVFMT